MLPPALQQRPISLRASTGSSNEQMPKVSTTVSKDALANGIFAASKTASVTEAGQCWVVAARDSATCRAATCSMASQLSPMTRSCTASG
eukprot:scaffold22748_cov120-Isochrysis_galbana.AAC.4